MRGQPTLVVLLIALMCAVRFGLAAYGYLAPYAMMEALGVPAAANPQMPYIVRVWAIRDVILAVLVVIARPGTIVPLLVACIVIDLTDIMSAWLSGRAGLFVADDTLSAMTTAIAALLPETLALLLILRRR